MNIHHLLTIVWYEMKILRRSFLFLLFSWIAVCGITTYQAIEQGVFGNSNNWGALPSFIPLLNVWLFNALQIIIASFAMLHLFHEKTDTGQVFLVRPISNLEYFWGRIVSIIILFSLLTLVVMGFAAIIHLFFSNTPFQIEQYLFYWLTLAIPTLVFILGLSGIIMRLTRNRSITILLIVGYFLMVYFLLADIHKGIFDLFAISVPTVFSDITGHVGVEVYLLQRSSFFLIGIGFLIICEITLPRLPNKLIKKHIIVLLGVVVILLGVCCCGWNLYRFSRDKIQRESYRESYQAYADLPKLRIVKQEITYRQEDKTLFVTSNFSVCNPLDSGINRFVLFLNPGLEIKHLTYQGKNIQYSRNNQVLLVEQGIGREDTLSFQMEYAGQIDERVYYLDVSEDEYDQVGNNFTVFPLGKKYTFVEKAFTLLTPGCLWYPVAVEPEKPKSPWTVIKNFTDYTLHVVQPEKKCVLSQGVSSQRNDTLTFHNTDKLTGLTLVMGDYTRKNIQSGDILFELYTFNGHQTDLDLFTTPAFRKVLAEAVEMNEEERQKKYPFKRLACIETPVNFASYTRSWNGGSEFVQPEMVFLPERGVGIRCDIKRLLKQNTTLETELEEIEENILRNLLYNLFKHDRDLMPLYVQHQNYISSEDFPSINVILNAMSEKRQDRFVRAHFDETTPERSGIQYLSSRSLKDALQDKMLDDEVLAEIVRIKGLELRNRIANLIDWKEFELFLETFKGRYKQEEITFEIFCKDFLLQFNLDLTSIIRSWFQAQSIPILLVKDITFMQVKNHQDRRYKIHFKVYNPSGTDGVMFGKTGTYCLDGQLENISFRPILVPAKGCKEIKMMYSLRPSGIDIRTGITGNIPNDYVVAFSSPRESNIRLTEDTLTGCFEISPFYFCPDADEIIVDNEDPGFSVVEAEGFQKLSDRFNKKLTEKYISVMDLSSRWRYVIENYAYGDTIRSIVGKKEGNGKGKAIWSTNLPQEGNYDVYIHNVRSTLINVVVGAQQYTIQHARGETSVDLPMGNLEDEWILAGRFFFSKGNTRICLNDKKGTTDDKKMQVRITSLDGTSAPQFIFADAVKWKYVKK